MILPKTTRMASIGYGESSEGSQRRERAAIAAQACQTCRNRKSKCDEQRPKCGLCRRLNVECEYREPLPTKKDKTMVHILETLGRLETKFDNLAIGRGSVSTPDGLSPGGLASTSTMAESINSGTRIGREEQQQNRSADPRSMHQHLTVPHKVMLWPGIYIHLINSGITAAADLQHVLQEGTPWFNKLEIEKHPNAIPADVGLPCFAVNLGAHEAGRSSNVAFPTLTVQQIQEYSDAYFNTFNVLYPLLSRHTFMNEIVARLLREGYADGDAGAVLALLVFALGQLAIEGVFDRPLGEYNGIPSGFRGGTLEHPPGLNIFNEARRRIGFVHTQSSLENVQIFLLQGSYFEANARHLDFWRSTVAASMACQVLIRCNIIPWSTPQGDMVKRAYWACILNEDLYHLDLDLPQTGIHLLEDEVPLPYFNDGSDPQQHQEQQQSATISNAQQPNSHALDEPSHFQYHFLAMIALRRLIARIHAVIHECERAQASGHAHKIEPLWRGRGKEAQGQETPSTSSTQPGDNAEDYGGPPVAVIREMARQLDSWRALLPRPLQWTDSDRFNYPATNPTNRRPNEPLFTQDQGPIPIGHRFNLDIVTAQLRTRFYYARFMMYRPFVYKALHFPELMTNDDYNCCALAIKSACLWPLAMAPPKNKKRLVPHLFAWTQNFVGILLILRMCSVNDCLRSIVDEGGVVGWHEIDSTIQIMLEWVQDVRQVDGVADWAWKVVQPLFSTDRT